MEFMKLNGFLSKQVSKLLNKVLKKHLGFDPDICVNNLNLQEQNGLMILEIKLCISTQDFDKVIEEVTK